MKKIKFFKVLVPLMVIGILSTSFTQQKQNNDVQLVEINTIYGRIILALYNETPLHRDNFLNLVREKKLDSLLFHRVVPQLLIQGGDPRSKYATKDQHLGTSDSGQGIQIELSSNLFNKRGALVMARDRRDPLKSSQHQFYIIHGRTFTVDELSEIQNSNNVIGKREVLNRILKSDSVQAKFDDFKLRGDKDGLHNYMVGLQDQLDKIYEPMSFSFSQDQISTYMKVGGAPNLDGLYTVFGEVVFGMNVVDSIANTPCDSYERPIKDIRMTATILKRPTPVQR